MDRDEKVALKAACIQAAATLVAALSPPPLTPGTPAAAQRSQAAQAADTGNCARYARDLFGKLTNEPWE